MQSVRETIARIAQEEGISPEYALAVAERESRFRPDSGGTGTIRGLFQMTGANRQRYGIPDDAGLEAQVRGFARFTKDLRADMARRLGREPTNEEAYLGHHFGAGRGAATAAGHFNGMAPGQVFTPQEMAGNPHFARHGTMDALSRSITGDMQRRFARHGGEGALPQGSQPAAGAAPDFSAFGEAASAFGSEPGTQSLELGQGAIGEQKVRAVADDANVARNVAQRRDDTVNGGGAIPPITPDGAVGKRPSKDLAVGRQRNIGGLDGEGSTLSPSSTSSVVPKVAFRETDAPQLVADAAAGQDVRHRKSPVSESVRPGTEIDLSGFGEQSPNDQPLTTLVGDNPAAFAKPERASIQLRRPGVPPLPSPTETMPEPAGLGLQLGAFQQPNPYYPDIAVGAM